MSATDKRPAELFTYERTLSGYDVIDVRTGHSMGFERETARAANGIAQTLNAAAKSGPRVLARALKSA